MLKFQLRASNGCVIWTRVSTAKQEENGGSLDYQKQICERYAQEHGLEIKGYYGGTHESAKVPGNLFKEMIMFLCGRIFYGTIIIFIYKKLFFL